MRIVINKINERPIVVKKENLDRVYREQVGRKNQQLFKLYSLGVLTNPVFYDEKQVVRYIMEEYQEAMNYLRNCADGSIVIGLQHMKLAKRFVKDEEFQELADILINYFDSAYVVKELDRLYRRFNKKCMTEAILQVRASISQSTVSMRCGVDFMHPIIQSLVEFKENEQVSIFDMSECIMFGIAKYLGVAPLVYKQRACDNESFFIKGLTFKEECEYIPLILSGEASNDGIFGEKLKKKIREYYNSNFNDDDNKIGYESFEEAVYTTCFDLREEKLGTFGISNGIYTPFLADNYRIFYIMKGKKSEPIYQYDNGISMGFYALDWETGKCLDAINQISGISGEFLSTNAVKKNKYNTNGGHPVMLSVDGELEEFYSLDTLTVVDKDGNETQLKPWCGNTIQFEYESIDEMFKRNGAKADYSMANKVDELYLDEYGAKEKELQEGVEELIIAFMYAQCGYIDYISGIRRGVVADVSKHYEMIKRAGQVVKALH